MDGAKADPEPGASQAFIDQQLADRAYLATKTDIGALYSVHRGLSDVNAATDAMALFNRASYYPPALLVLVFARLVVAG